MKILNQHFDYREILKSSNSCTFLFEMGFFTFSKYSVTQNLAEKNQITDIQNILYGNQDQIPMMARVVEKASSRYEIFLKW